MSEKEQIAIREIEDILNNDVYILPKGAILYPIARHGYIKWLPKLKYLHPDEFEIKDDEIICEYKGSEWKVKFDDYPKVSKEQKKNKLRFLKKKKSLYKRRKNMDELIKYVESKMKEIQST